MMDFIPDAQTLLIVVQGVDTGKPGYDKEKVIDAGLKYFQFWKICIALSGLTFHEGRKRVRPMGSFSLQSETKIEPDLRLVEKGPEP